MSVEITVPDIGDFDSVDIIEVLVAPGDKVAPEDPILVLESDKATMEVPSPRAGTIDALTVAVGDKVRQGSVIALLTPTDDAARPEPSAPPAPSRPEPPPSVPAPAPPPAPPPATGGSLPHASPSVRRFARELGVDLLAVNGSGPKGRILKDDVQGFVKQALQGGTSPGAGSLPPAPVVDFSKFGAVELRPLARIRKLSAANLHRSWILIPHVTQHDWADISELEAFRKAESERTGVKITLLPILLKALARLLRTYPEFNSSLDATGENLVMKQYLHMGFAADTPNGLVVPVIRDVPDKSITELAAEAAALAAKARDGKLAPADMQGSCFTVSSLGGIGGSHFTPIVNLPEVAILGVSRAQMQPVWNGTEFVPRLMLPLSLSYDHRVIDGAAAARFTTALADLLADLRRILL